MSFKRTNSLETFKKSFKADNNHTLRLKAITSQVCDTTRTFAEIDKCFHVLLKTTSNNGRSVRAGVMSSAIGVASALLFIALLLSLAAAESKWEEILKTPWEELEKRTRTAPRFMTQQFHDRPLPVEQIPQFPHQADKMCNCKLHGGDWSK